MKITITGRKVSLKESFKRRVDTKIKKLSRFFDDSAECEVLVHVEKGRQTVEITIRDSGMIYRAEETAADMVDALEKVCDVLVRKINDNKGKLERRMHADAFDDFENNEAPTKDEFNVVRTKSFGMKPMSVDEAILQMNMLGHMFFVFINMDTDFVNVVYRRKSGDYGLIEADTN